jgi:hypothetical protein
MTRTLAQTPYKSSNSGLIRVWRQGAMSVPAWGSDIPHRLTVPHLQEGVGIHQKLKIGFFFCECKAL